jgi:hypothetical protein
LPLSLGATSFALLALFNFRPLWIFVILREERRRYQEETQHHEY